MNLDQLLGSLNENDPDPGSVLARVAGKQRAARNRRYTALGAMAVAVLAIIGGVVASGALSGPGSGPSSTAAGAPAVSSAAAGSSSGPSVTRPNAQPAYGSSGSSASGGGSSGSCAAVPLRDAVAQAVGGGASVIIGDATPTGGARTVGAPGQTYYAVRLTSVQMLAGRAVTTGSTAWIPAASGDGTPGTEGQALWADGGELFAIVTPATADGPGGPVLRAAPVTGGDVIFSPYGCWDPAGLPATPYHGGGVTVFGPAQVPGPAHQPTASTPPASAGATPAEYAVPVTTVKQAVQQAAHPAGQQTGQSGTPAR
ncbi:MAG TPA: hypothetical protein VH478_05525 [Trebonia sp.]|nr:hypothetical protein [Trebonia sp.]